MSSTALTLLALAAVAAAGSRRAAGGSRATSAPPARALQAGRALLREFEEKDHLVGRSVVVDGWWIEAHTLGCRGAADDPEELWEERHFDILRQYETDGRSVVLSAEHGCVFVTLTPQRLGSGAIPKPASLREASLSAQDLRGAELRGVDLDGANLDGSILMGQDLRGVSLRGASLVGASLMACDLQGADLRDADLRGAELSADLRGADLRGSNLDGTNLRGAKYNASTRFTEGFQPWKRWMSRQDD